MAAIPAYWYVEPVSSGDSFEILPVGQVRPIPASDGSGFFDLTTGEIYSEAILMCALPWPRFRNFSDGKQVILPEGMAEALEGLEDVITSVDGMDELVKFECHGSDRGYHVRVECTDGKVFMSFHCNCTFPLERRNPTAVGVRR